jgi:hypothetical protein
MGHRKCERGGHSPAPRCTGELRYLRYSHLNGGQSRQALHGHAASVRTVGYHVGAGSTAEPVQRRGRRYTRCVPNGSRCPCNMHVLTSGSDHDYTTLPQHSEPRSVPGGGDSIDRLFLGTVLIAGAHSTLRCHVSVFAGATDGTELSRSEAIYRRLTKD